MVGGDHDQGVGQGRVGQPGLGQRGLDGVVESDGVGQRALGVGTVQRVVDAAAFHHQEVAVGVLRQQVHGLDRHLGQARLRGALAQRRRGGAIEFVFEVAAAAVQADELLASGGVHLGLVGGHRVALGGQLGQQVAAIGAAGGVAGAEWREVVAATAHQHIDAIAQGRVETGAAGHQLRGDLVLGVAVADVRPGRRRRGVGQLGGGNRAHGLALGLGQFQDGGSRGAVGGRAVVHAEVAVGVAARVGGHGFGRHRDHLVVHFDAGHVGGHRRGAVGGLGVGREGLDARSALERVHGQAAVFAVLVDARGGDGGGAHAVTEEENDVLGFAGGVRWQGESRGKAQGQAGRNQGRFHVWYPCESFTGRRRS